MKIEILYFAYLREQLGFDREEAETPDDVRTVGRFATGSSQRASPMPRPLRISSASARP